MVKNMKKRESKKKKLSSSQIDDALLKNDSDISEEHLEKNSKDLSESEKTSKTTKDSTVEKKAEKTSLGNKKIKKDKDTKKSKKTKKSLTQADIKKYSSTQIDHVILKIKANERKYTIISVCVILTVFLVCSYFVFSAIQNSSVKPTFKIGRLYYEFNETDNGLGDVISLVDVLPISDKEGLKTKTYTVRLYNSADEKTKFNIFILDDKEMVSFDGCSDKVVDRQFIKYIVNDRKILVLSDNEEDSIISGELGPKESRTYVIKCWISNTYLKNTGVHYHGTISVRLDNDDVKGED